MGPYWSSSQVKLFPRHHCMTRPQVVAGADGIYLWSVATNILWHVDPLLGNDRETSNFFYYLVCEAIGTAATPGLLCQPRVIVNMIMEKQMECRLARETEVLGEKMPQRHFCPSQNPI
jgi:hypothetical protein